MALVAEDLDETGTAKGKRLQRPGLKLALAQFPNVSALIIPKVDRLARSTKDFLEIIELAEKHNVTIISVADGVLTGPGGKLQGTLLSVFAEFEAGIIATRVKEAHHHLKTVGRWPGGRTPFGYKAEKISDGNGYRLVPDEIEAQVVREAAVLVLSGVSLWSTAKKLMVVGYENRNGKVLTDTLLKKVLLGPSIRGWVVAEGSIITGTDGLPKVLHAPIIDEETAVRLQDLLGTTKTRKTPQRRSETLLSGFLACGECSANLHYRQTKDQYECSACRKVVIKRLKVEPIVIQAINERHPYFTMILPPPTEPADLSFHNAQIERLSLEIAKPGSDVMALAEKLMEAKERREEAASHVLLARRLKSLKGGNWEGYSRDVLQGTLVRVVVSPCGRGSRHTLGGSIQIEFKAESGPVSLQGVIWKG